VAWAADQGLTTVTVGAGEPVFSEAGCADDADIRRLLREHPMPGAVSVSLEREPSLRAGQALEGGDHRTLVCRAGAGGPLLALGAVCTRTMLVGGAERPVAYLGQLRLSPAARGKRGLIVEGYRRMGAMVGTPLAFTSILDDNLVARRLLERNLPGMPEYRFTSAFETFVLGRGGASGAAVRLGAGDAEHVAALLRRSNERFALAPHWTGAEVGRLIEGGMLTVLGGRGTGGLRGCAGVWDVSSGKQVVVRGYSGVLASARGLINLTAGVTGAPRMPPVGEPLRLRFLSHLAVDGCDAGEVRGLVGAACAVAKRQRASLVAGVAPCHIARSELARRAWSTLRSRVYSVRWPDASTPLTLVRSDETGCIHLEAALL
jgi:hypothetical protein